MESHMPYWKSAADILPQIEPAGGGRTAQNLAGYKVAGAAISAATTTGGYLYSGETYAPGGYKKSGAQVVFQRAGCRPRTGAAFWTSGSAGTAYIHRYAADGSIRVTGSAAHDGSGVNIAPVAGCRYLLVRLAGGGGGGGKAGVAPGNTGYGGGSGGVAVCCIKLPEEGYATLVVGAGGGGTSEYLGNGSNGGASSVVCGGFSCTANGGGRGTYNGGAGGGGGVSSSGDNADGVLIASASGNGGGQTDGGAARALGYTDYAPEGGSMTFSGYGAGGGSENKAYGNGLAGAVGRVELWY
jgi:hypothetical protein